MAAARHLSFILRTKGTGLLSGFDHQSGQCTVKGLNDHWRHDAASCVPPDRHRLRPLALAHSGILCRPTTQLSDPLRLLIGALGILYPSQVGNRNGSSWLRACIDRRLCVAARPSQCTFTDWLRPEGFHISVSGNWLRPFGLSHGSNQMVLFPLCTADGNTPVGALLGPALLVDPFKAADRMQQYEVRIT